MDELEVKVEILLVLGSRTVVIFKVNKYLGRRIALDRLSVLMLELFLFAPLVLKMGNVGRHIKVLKHSKLFSNSRTIKL